MFGDVRSFNELSLADKATVSSLYTAATVTAVAATVVTVSVLLLARRVRLRD